MAQNKHEVATSTQSNKYEEKNFDLLVDGVPYIIKSTPFLYNDDLRFRVSVNNDAEHIFTWDSALGRLAPINDDSSTLPVGLEEAIAERLQSSRR